MFAAALVTAGPTLGWAQAAGGTARWQPELRADFVGARSRAVHVGAGVAVPAGTYARLALVGAAGGAWRGDSSVVAGRVDGLVRFVVDPLREFRWAPYASGGVSALYDEREEWRAVLTGALGIEGPAMSGLVPAVELGFGGGARIGLVARRAMRGRR